MVLSEMKEQWKLRRLSELLGKVNCPHVAVAYRYQIQDWSRRANDDVQTKDLAISLNKPLSNRRPIYLTHAVRVLDTPRRGSQFVLSCFAAVVSAVEMDDASSCLELIGVSFSAQRQFSL